MYVISMFYKWSRTLKCSMKLETDKYVIMCNVNVWTRFYSIYQMQTFYPQSNKNNNNQGKKFKGNWHPYEILFFVDFTKGELLFSIQTDLHLFVGLLSPSFHSIIKQFQQAHKCILLQFTFALASVFLFSSCHVASE